MPDTANLALPYMEAAQAQKHVTHNEALAQLDACVQLSVLARGLAAPPTNAPRGARYIVAGFPSGDFVGHADEIAYRDEAGWRFAKPQVGWLAWVQADDAPFIFHDGMWTRFDVKIASPSTLRLAGLGAPVEVVAARALASGDEGRVLSVNSANALTLSVPATLPAGFSCVVVQRGAGQVSFAAGAGVTLGQPANAFKTAGRYARADLVCLSAGVFALSGSLVA